MFKGFMERARQGPTIRRRSAERIVRDTLRELNITYPEPGHERELIDRVLDNNPDVEEEGQDAG